MKYDSTIYIGDSRTVGMKDAVAASDNETYIAEVGMGYSWFNSTAMPKLEKMLESNQKVNVVINMGTNDLTNKDAPAQYSALYKKLAEKYTETSFIILSVTPIEDDMNRSYKSVNNDLVINFNKGLVTQLGSGAAKYCNIYDKTVAGKFKTTDGLHYDTESYKKIYNYIKGC